MSLSLLATIALSQITISTQQLPRILTTHRSLSQETLQSLKTKLVFSAEELEGMGIKRKVINKVEHLYDQNLGGLMDMSYALVTLRIFDRYKSGSVIKSKDLSPGERTALLSNLWPEVRETGINKDFEIGFSSRSGVSVSGNNKRVDLYTQPNFPDLPAFPKKLESETSPSKSFLSSPLASYEEFYSASTIKTTKLIGRMSHSQILDESAALLKLVGEELSLIKAELDQATEKSRAKHSLKLAPVGSLLSEADIDQYPSSVSYGDYLENKDDLRLFLARNKVDKSFISFSLKVNFGDRSGSTGLRFDRF